MLKRKQQTGKLEIFNNGKFSKVLEIESSHSTNFGTMYCNIGYPL